MYMEFNDAGDRSILQVDNFGRDTGLFTGKEKGVFITGKQWVNGLPDRFTIGVDFNDFKNLFTAASRHGHIPSLTDKKIEAYQKDKEGFMKQTMEKINQTPGVNTQVFLRVGEEGEERYQGIERVDDSSGSVRLVLDQLADLDPMLADLPINYYDFKRLFSAALKGNGTIGFTDKEMEEYEKNHTEFMEKKIAALENGDTDAVKTSVQNLSMKLGADTFHI